MWLDDGRVQNAKRCLIERAHVRICTFFVIHLRSLVSLHSSSSLSLQDGTIDVATLDFLPFLVYMILCHYNTKGPTLGTRDVSSSICDELFKRSMGDRSWPVLKLTICASSM